MTNEQKLDRIITLLESQDRTLALIAELLSERNPQHKSGPQKSGEWKGQKRDEPLDTETPRGAWCDYLMPFGKHQGKRLDECPASYLAFFVRQIEAGEMRDGDCKNAIMDYIASSANAGKAQPPETPAKAPVAKKAANVAPQSSVGNNDDVPF